MITTGIIQKEYLTMTCSFQILTKEIIKSSDKICPRSKYLLLKLFSKNNFEKDYFIIGTTKHHEDEFKLYTEYIIVYRSDVDNKYLEDDLYGSFIKLSGKRFKISYRLHADVVQGFTRFRFHCRYNTRRQTTRFKPSSGDLRYLSTLINLLIP